MYDELIVTIGWLTVEYTTTAQSLSQPTHTISTDETNEYISATQGNSYCLTCKRTFKNATGLQQHVRTCKTNTRPTVLVREASELQD